MSMALKFARNIFRSTYPRLLAHASSFNPKDQVALFLNNRPSFYSCDCFNYGEQKLNKWLISPIER